MTYLLHRNITSDPARNFELVHTASDGIITHQWFNLEGIAPTCDIYGNRLYERGKTINSWIVALTTTSPNTSAVKLLTTFDTNPSESDVVNYLIVNHPELLI